MNIGIIYFFLLQRGCNKLKFSNVYNGTPKQKSMTTKSKAYIGHLMILATTIIYSFNTNFMKVVTPEWIHPNGLVLLRCAASVLGFWLISLLMPSSRRSAKPTRKDIGMMLLGGLLGLGGNLLLYINGLSLTGPIDAFVIRTTQPIIVIALGVIFLHAAFTKYKTFGILLGLAGALYASITPHAGVVKDSFGGDILVFSSSISYAFFLILIKPYTAKFDSVTVMKWMSLSSLVLTFPFGIYQVVHAPLFTGDAPLHIWLELVYTLVFATLIGYFLSVYALHYITPFVESAYRYLLPITGAAVSILLGLQKFSWHDPIALALIVFGFILINKKKKAKTSETR